jgi:sulfide:quinone oxidoreductase
MSGKTIVVLGGGSGGIVCANELRKKLSREHRVILIDKDEEHTFYPSLLWLIFGLRKPEQIKRSLRTLNRKGVDFIQGEITEISIDKKSVSLAGQDINYDYLVISLGAELNKMGIPKTPRIFNFYCMEGAKLSGEAIKKISSGKIVVLIGGMPFKCPAAPYEFAFLIDSFFKNKDIRDRISIEVYTPETLPMPTAGPQIGNMLKAMLESKQISFNPEYKFKSIDEGKIYFENNKTTNFDLLFVVPPHTAPEVVKKANLANESGWIPADRETLKTRFENVYAIGDVTSIKLPGQYKPDKPLNLPKAGVFAHYQAETVAENISKEINRQKPDKRFLGDGYCFLELGSHKAGFAKGNFYGTPSPLVTIYNPGKIWHLGKIAFEKWWFWKWF